MSNCSCNSGGSFVQFQNYSQGKSGNNLQRPYAAGQLSQPLLSIFNPEIKGMMIVVGIILL